MTQAANERYVADRPMPGIFFRGMTAIFRVRDWLRPRGVLLDEIPLKAGDTVMDYGCGPGSYIPELAARVGKGGVVIAVDIHPLAIQGVEALARRQGLHNVQAYLSDGVHLPDLEDASTDVVVLFDVFHMIGDQAGVLREMHRILRPGGILAVNDHHMDQDDLAARVTRGGNFRLAKRGMHSFTFTPVVGQTAGGTVR
jgi:ubiquinone/menaquinone biosynthesis C-methylase UbiE